MKATLATKISLLLLVVCLVISTGCDTTGGSSAGKWLEGIGSDGGAEIWLEGVSTGTLSMKDKPIAGLPSGKVNLVLKVSAKKVNISTTGGVTTIKLSPSDGTIVIGPDGVSVTGVEPDQIEMKWQASE